MIREPEGESAPAKAPAPGGPAPAVLVAGGSGGLGGAVALEFARARGAVGVGWREHEAEAARIVAAAEGLGARSRAFRADLTRPAEVRAMVSAFAEFSGGRLDVAVYAAGDFDDRRVSKMTDEQFDRVLAANLDGAFYFLRAVARRMMRAREGCVLLVGSIAGSLGRAGGANYAAAKAGLVALAKSAARELGPSNVRVNAVLPGFLPGTRMGARATDEFRERTIAESVLARAGAEAEVAGFLRVLSGLENVTGQVFNLDGRIVPWT